MIIFLYGPDSFRSRQKLEELINHYKQSGKSGLNLIYLDAEQTDFLEFFNQLKTSGMFEEKKLIILKNVFLNKDFQEEFLSKVDIIQNLKDVIVVYESDAVDERLKLFKVLTQKCRSQEFILLDSRRLRVFAQQEFKALDQRINQDALDLLLQFVDNDLWRLSNEIKKLADFSSSALTESQSYGGSAVALGGGGKKHRTINVNDINLLVRPTIEVDIFKTIDALSTKNKKQAMNLLQKHLDEGESPLYLLSMVAYQFKNLLIIKELAEKGLLYGSIVKKSGLHPFVVKKNYFVCRQFSLGELKNIYHKLFQIDLDIKTGKIEAETALYTLVSLV